MVFAPEAHAVKAVHVHPVAVVQDRLPGALLQPRRNAAALHIADQPAHHEIRAVHPFFNQLQGVGIQRPILFPHLPHRPPGQHVRHGKVDALAPGTAAYRGDAAQDGRQVLLHGQACVAIQRLQPGCALQHPGKRSARRLHRQPHIGPALGQRSLRSARRHRDRLALLHVAVQAGAAEGHANALRRGAHGQQRADHPADARLAPGHI